jgi:tripartite-type tricarboxylate transporter receptor subunit TctC
MDGAQFDDGIQQLTDSLQQIKAGQLRALAVLGPKRAAAIPDVPTIAEAGFPDVQGVTFNGVFAPKATPPAVVQRLSTVVQAALKKPSAIEKLAALGSEARGSTPQEFTKFLQDESSKWIDVMKRANLKVSK